MSRQIKLSYQASFQSTLHIGRIDPMTGLSILLHS